MSNEENKTENPQPGSGKSEQRRPEIRYVPLDIWAIENEDDEIDLVEILKMFWESRKTIYKMVAIFAVLGLFVALVSVEEYTSEVKVLPERQDGLSLGGLGGLAQQFGFSPATRQNNEGIPSTLYPEIIESNVFLAELMDYEVPLPDSPEQITIKEYFKEHQKTSIIKSFLKYTVLLPVTLKNRFFRDQEGIRDPFDGKIADNKKLNRLVRMSNEDWMVVRNLRDRIITDRNSETGVVTVTVKMQNSVIAAAVADEVVQNLSDYVTENRTEKARRDTEFIEKRFEEARERFEAAQRDLAKFNDANRGQLTAMARTEEQLLQSRYDLNFNLYNSLAERLEEARIKLQEETPVINILEPAAIPLAPSAPDRIFIVTALTILGGLAGVTIVLVRPFYKRLANEITNQ